MSRTCLGVVGVADVCRHLLEHQPGIGVERPVMGPLLVGEEGSRERHLRFTCRNTHTFTAMVRTVAF